MIIYIWNEFGVANKSWHIMVEIDEGTGMRGSLLLDNAITHAWLPMPREIQAFNFYLALNWAEFSKFWDPIKTPCLDEYHMLVGYKL